MYPSRVTAIELPEELVQAYLATREAFEKLNWKYHGLVVEHGTPPFPLPKSPPFEGVIECLTEYRRLDALWLEMFDKFQAESGVSVEELSQRLVILFKDQREREGQGVP